MRALAPGEGEGRGRRGGGRGEQGAGGGGSRGTAWLAAAAAAAGVLLARSLAARLLRTRSGTIGLNLDRVQLHKGAGAGPARTDPARRAPAPRR